MDSCQVLVVETVSLFCLLCWVFLPLTVVWVYPRGFALQEVEAVDGFPAVVSAMQAFPADVQVLSNGCAVLARLPEATASDREAAAAAGALPVLVAVLLHRSEVDLLLAACRVLIDLVRDHGGNQQRAIAAGALAVLAALLANPATAAHVRLSAAAETALLWLSNPSLAKARVRLVECVQCCCLVVSASILNR